MDSNTLKELLNVLKPFVEFPLKGIHGGPLCVAKGLYEDGTDENSARHKGSLDPKDFEKARIVYNKYSIMETSMDNIVKKLEDIILNSEKAEYKTQLTNSDLKTLKEAILLISERMIPVLPKHLRFDECIVWLVDSRKDRNIQGRSINPKKAVERAIEKSEISLEKI